MEDSELIELLTRIDEVLHESHADTQVVLTAGIQLIKASFVQIARDNPQADMMSLADSITETLNRSMKHLVLYPQKIAEA